MERNTIEKIFNFLEEKEGKEIPSKWNKLMLKYKLTQDLETHPDGSQYRYEGELNLSYSKITKLPGYKTKITKQGTFFMEPLGKRLKRGSGEIPEINFYKQNKRRR
jgi:hypothetical protein